MKDESAAYQEALDYLYSFVDYSLTHNLSASTVKFDLSRMALFLDHLGNPHRQYPVVHVAGTKGKGSTAALIASALQASGHRVGFYTSPHLQEYTERIQVNGQEIGKGELARLVDEIKPRVAEMDRLTTFEITTALAMIYFAKQKVDVAVLEVGLGGRLDSTNVVDPLLSVITSLSMDHMAVLGDTLPKIAYEKAGIIKDHRPVVSALQKAEALQVIEQVAAEHNSPLTKASRDYAFQPLQHNLDGQTFQIWPVGRELEAQELFIPLLGLHQVENAVTAYAALKIINQQGLAVSPEAIQSGFAHVVWPGRFEILRREPPVIVDSAHNRDSALRLRQTLDDYLPGRRVVFLMGASEDKDIDGILSELLPRVDLVIATQSVHPRALAADQLVEMVQRYGRPAEAVVPVEEALQTALERAGKDGVVLAAGSLFVAAAVRESWQKFIHPAI